MDHAAEQFAVSGRLVLTLPTGSGNVNDTFVAIFRTTFSEERVIVQRINRKVFNHPEWIMANMRAVTEYIHRRLENESDRWDRVWQVPRVIPCHDGHDYYIDEAGDFWRAITLIASARSFDRPQNTEHAFEAGTVLGQFHRLLSDMSTEGLRDTLPGFHVTPRYLAQYDQTLVGHGRRIVDQGAMEVRRLTRFIEQRRGLTAVLQQALDDGRLSERLIHGDPKVTNIMIDDFTGKGTSIVDLDTVKPGLIHYDFGDALRSICNPAGEEASNLREVYFDLDLCRAFVSGYLEIANEFLTPDDKSLLFDAIRLLAFELGLRFFRDYLEGNVYFKARHAEQNLNRARVQFRLCESIETRENMIRDALDAHS